MDHREVAENVRRFNVWNPCDIVCWPAEKAAGTRGESALTIGFLILLWIGCTIFLGPIIGLLGLNRSHEEEAKVTPEQWQLRINHLLGYVGLPGGTLGILYQLQRLDPDSGALALVLFSGGFFILIIVLALVSRLFPTISGKNGYYLVLCTIFTVSILTYRADRKVETAREANDDAIIAEMAAIDKQAMREWIEDLYASGAHGAPGKIPPMLEVIDTGEGMQVKNLASRSVCIQIRRHIEVGSVPDRFRCSLLSRNREGDCTHLGPGNSDWFELGNSPDRQACLGQPLIFMVGNRITDADVAWWSDPEIALLEAEIRNPTSHYGSTGRFTLQEALASYRSLLRQGDRAGMWRAHIGAAELVDSVEPAPAEEKREVSAELASELGPARKRVGDLERFREKLDPAAHNLPDYLKVSSDWKDEIVLANATHSAKRVHLLRVGRDSQGDTFLCAMQGSDENVHGTLIPRNQSATFNLPSGSPCPPNRRFSTASGSTR